MAPRKPDLLAIARARFSEKLIRRIAPAWALNREKARARLAYIDGYDAGRPDRTRRTYRGGGGSPDRHMLPGALFQLRELCRYHDRTSALFAGLLNTACDEIVGPEFGFKPDSGDDGYDREAQAWIAHCMAAGQYDYRGEMGFRDGLKLTLRALWVDGDILHVDVEGGRQQTFEAHQLASPAGIDTGDGFAGIVNGVQWGVDGRVSAYYVARPSVGVNMGFVASGSDLQRVPAEYCLLPAVRKRFNQTRGIPFAATALEMYDRLDGYLDSETFAAEMNARLGFQITSDPADNGDGRPGVEANPDRASTFDQVQKMESGTIVENLPHEKVEMIGTVRPSDAFEPYTVAVCRILGVSVGFPLELMLKDFSRTNYSSARACLNVAHRSFRGWQSTLRDVYCLPWYRRRIAQGLALGAISVPPGDADPYVARPIWPAWELLDLLKEMTAHQVAVSIGVRSRHEIIRERGGDPDTVLRELEEERDWPIVTGPAAVTPSASEARPVNPEPLDDDDEITPTPDEA